MQKMSGIVLAVSFLLMAVLAGCARAPEANEVIPSKIDLESEDHLEQPGDKTNVSDAETASGVTEPGNNIVPYGEEKTVDGYQLADGMDVPVTVTFCVDSVVRGEEAYGVLVRKNPDLAQPEAGMEYLLAELCVTYDKGESEYLNLAENHASLASANLYFALISGDSNAQQVTGLVEHPVYDLLLAQGETGKGQVAFLLKESADGQLVFAGYDNEITFEIK